MFRLVVIVVAVLAKPDSQHKEHDSDWGSFGLGPWASHLRGLGAYVMGLGHSWDQRVVVPAIHLY